MSDRLLLALTQEMRAAREDLKAIKNNGNGGIPRGWVKWILGIVAGLIVIGVASNVRSSANVQADVKALTTNVQLLRVEVQREFDRQERELNTLNAKVDRHMAATGGGAS